MSRTPLLALAAAVALAASGCAKSACQELGERLCNCQPGMTQDTCKTQVTDQLNGLGVDTPGFGGMLGNVAAGAPGTFEDRCQARLDACVAPEGVDFCQWILTAAAKDACGLTPANP